MSLLKRIIPKIIGTGINLLGLWTPEKAGAIAFDIFCTPRAGRIGEKDRIYLNSADVQEQLKTPHGFTKAYEWNPNAPQTILLLHGWESNTARWQQLLLAMQPLQYRIIGIDAPAHGASDGNRFTMVKYAEAIHVAVNQYKPDYIIGHSLGGATLSYYLAHYEYPPIDKLVLMGAPSELSAMIKGGFSSILGLSDKTLRGLFNFFEKQFDHPVEYFSSAKFCQSLKIPALVIHDEKDSIVSVQSGEAIHQSLVNSEFLLTKDLGHSLQDQFVFERIVDFLNRE